MTVGSHLECQLHHVAGVLWPPQRGQLHLGRLALTLLRASLHVLLGPGEQVQQRGGAEAHARLLLLVVELDYDVLHLVAPLKPTPAVILQT